MMIERVGTVIESINTITAAHPPGGEYQVCDTSLSSTHSTRGYSNTYQQVSGRVRYKQAAKMSENVLLSALDYKNSVGKGVQLLPPIVNQIF